MVNAASRVKSVAAGFGQGSGTYNDYLAGLKNTGFGVTDPNTLRSSVSPTSSLDPFEGKKRYVDPYDPQANQVPMLVSGQGGNPIPVFDLDQARQMVSQGFTIQGWRLADVSEGVAFASDPAKRRLFQQNRSADETAGQQPVPPTPVSGTTGFPSSGLASAEETGLVGQVAGAIPATFGPEGKRGLPFLSNQQWGKLLPSEQRIWEAEIESRGFPLEDFRAQRQRQTSSAGFATKPGPQSFGGQGGRLSLQAQSFR